MADIPNELDSRHRRPNMGTIELNAPNVDRLVVLNELDGADAELAAKFGYKPVFKRVDISSSI